MRGGAIPILAWGTLLLVLFIGNWIWDNRGVNPLAAGIASALIYAFGLLLSLARREAVRRGPPPSSPGLDPVPEASVGAVLVGISIGCILFGVVWSTFFVYFGAGLLLLAVGRLALELRAERRALERAARAER